MEQVIFFSPFCYPTSPTSWQQQQTVKCLNENESLHKQFYSSHFFPSSPLSTSFVCSSDFAMMKSYVHSSTFGWKEFSLSLSLMCVFFLLVSISMLNKFFALFLKRQQKKFFFRLRISSLRRNEKKKKIACVVFGIDEMKEVFFRGCI